MSKRKFDKVCDKHCINERLMKSAQIKLFLSDFEKSKCYYHNRKNDLINIKRNDKMKSVEVVIKAMIVG